MQLTISSLVSSRACGSQIVSFRVQKRDPEPHAQIETGVYVRGYEAFSPKINRLTADTPPPKIIHAASLLGATEDMSQHIAFPNQTQQRNFDID